MEKETLKEAVENYLKDVNTKVHKDLERDNWLKVGFINGAKWQQEQDKKLYSEEDMEKSFEAGRSYHEHLEMQKAKYFEPDDTHKIDYKKYSFKEWFEQFKKK